MTYWLRYLLPILLLVGCGPIPVQIQATSQQQRQAQEQSNEQQQRQSADQQSEARQGTNSMPVIIICNTVSSPNGHCIAPNPEGALQKAINDHLKGSQK